MYSADITQNIPVYSVISHSVSLCIVLISHNIFQCIVLISHIVLLCILLLISLIVSLCKVVSASVELIQILLPIPYTDTGAKIPQCVTMNSG